MRALLLAALAALALVPAAHAARHDPEKMPVTHIRDLHFGDVLFLYFQNDDEHDFEALTRLLAYDQWKRMPHHEDDAQLLAAGLYLQLGMHNEAGARFAKLLNNDVPTGVRNRAWLYLGQIWYARGYLGRAERALRKVNGRMSADFEAQKELLLANILIHLNRYDEAIQLLSGWRGGPVWSAYARFNLGVALVRNNRLPDAATFLTNVGTMQADTPELTALKDRANLALGFAYLQANQPQAARAPLARVRLNGPYSNRALLGIGWANASLGDYRGALTPWMELRSRDVLDAAVQESYLAVPYAFSKLNANAQSAEYYENAITSFDAENAKLDTAIAGIERGDMLSQILAEDQKAASSGVGAHGWFRDVKTLPAGAEAPYLYALLAGHDFQEGVKNYRDLVYMNGTLDHWGESMSAFQDMIDTRERAYAERLPKTDTLLASGVLQRLQQRKDALDNRLHVIESQHDVAALGSDTERDQWARVQRLESGLSAAPGTAENAEQHARVALLKGVLYYQLDEAFNARLWQSQRGLRDLSLALQEAQNHWIRVERARKAVPENTGEFAARVQALRLRIEALQGRLAAAETRQQRYLADLAVHELGQQKDRLAAYQVQARFALATMYDRAASSEEAHPPAAPANTPAPEAAPGAPQPPAVPPAPEPKP
jgi:hypothetical protein